MVAERPQSDSVDLPRPEQFGDLIADTTPDAAAHVSLEWDDLQPRPTWQDYLKIGSNAYALALKFERLHGLEDPDTVAAYRQASVNLIAVTHTGPINHRLRESEPTDPVRLLMIGTSLGKQADAPIVEPYGDGHFGAPVNRRSNLRRLSTEAMQRASDMAFGGAENNASWGARFDNASKPVEVIVSAAVEAALEVGTAEYVIGGKVVDDSTSERLQREGQSAVADFIERNAWQPKGIKFVPKMGEIAIEKLATRVYALPVGA